MRTGLIVVAVIALAGCTAAPTPEPTPSATPAGTHDTCLFGTWKSAPGEAGAFLAELVSAQFDAQPNLLTSIQTDGSMAITFAEDGTFLYQPDLTFLLTTATAQSPGSITGEASGTWTTQDDATLFANADTDQVGLTLTLDGVAHDSDNFGWTQLPLTVSRYTCGADELTIELNILDTSFPMEMVPTT